MKINGGDPMKKFLMIIAAFLVLLLGLKLYDMKEISADWVYGSGKYKNIEFHILNSKHEQIKSTSEQNKQLEGSSYVNVSNVVVYEQNKWFKHNKEALKIIRYETEFPNHDPPLEETDRGYYKLIGETIEPIDEKYSLFVRLYEKIDKYHNLFHLEPVPIVIPKTESVKEARKWINDNVPDYLRLKALTVVDPSLLDLWDEEAYTPEFEYTYTAREGLTIQDIIDKNL
jgi:hypothetical protein